MITFSTLKNTVIGWRSKKQFVESSTKIMIYRDMTLFMKTSPLSAFNTVHRTFCTAVQNVIVVSLTEVLYKQMNSFASQPPLRHDSHAVCNSR